MSDWIIQHRDPLVLALGLFGGLLTTYGWWLAARKPKWDWAEKPKTFKLKSECEDCHHIWKADYAIGTPVRRQKQICPRCKENLVVKWVGMRAHLEQDPDATYPAEMVNTPTPRIASPETTWPTDSEVKALARTCGAISSAVDRMNAKLLLVEDKIDDLNKVPNVKLSCPLISNWEPEIRRAFSRGIIPAYLSKHMLRDFPLDSEFDWMHDGYSYKYKPVDGKPGLWAYSGKPMAYAYDAS